MGAKTFSEKWDKEEREIESSGYSGLTTIKRKPLSDNWKKYLKYLLLGIAIVILLIIVIRIVL
ncbi:MAG: hypothetical protein AABX08_01385 [Nanoarchaeota archaeon]